MKKGQRCSDEMKKRISAGTIAGRIKAREFDVLKIRKAGEKIEKLPAKLHTT